MKTYVKDFWLWREIKIYQIHCDRCENSDSITIKKKDIPKLIKILQKLNYKGIPKRSRKIGQSYVVTDGETCA